MNDPTNRPQRPATPLAPPIPVHVPVTVPWPLEDLLGLKAMLWAAVADFRGRWARASLPSGLIVGVMRDPDTSQLTVRLTVPRAVTPEQQYQAVRIRDLWELRTWVSSKEMAGPERRLTYIQPEGAK